MTQGVSENCDAFMSSNISNLLAAAMATRRRTTCYESLLQPQPCFRTVACRKALVDLFAFLLLVVGSVRGNAEFRHGSEVVDKHTNLPFRVLHPDTLHEIKRLEDEVHVQASRYMQLRQTEMLGQLKRDQSALAEKLYAVDAKMRKIEERHLGNVSEHDENVGTGLTKPPPSQDEELDAEVQRNLEEKAECANKEDEGKE